MDVSYTLVQYNVPFHYNFNTFLHHGHTLEDCPTDQTILCKSSSGSQKQQIQTSLFFDKCQLLIEQSDLH